MAEKIIRARHYVYNINAHIVCRPRYRNSVLVGQLTIAAKYDIDVLAHEIMLDHVHWFVSAKPKYAPSQGVRLFKGTTSRMLMSDFEDLRQQDWGERTPLWAESSSINIAGQNPSSDTLTHVRI